MTPSSGNMNLFLHAGTLSSANESMDLFLLAGSAGSSGYIASLNLYINGEVISNSYLNLFTRGEANPQSSSGSMNLYLAANPYSSSESLNLYTAGSLGSGNYTSNYLNAYISGLGTSDGYIPASGYMNLSLRVNPGETSSINMYLYGNAPSSGSMNGYVFGVEGIASSGINLYTYGRDSISESLKLFIRGYDR